MRVLLIAAAILLFATVVASQDRAQVIVIPAKVYAEASSRSKVVAVLKKGTLLSVDGSVIKDGFYPVNIGKLYGWVSIKDVRLEGTMRMARQIWGLPVRQADRDYDAEEAAEASKDEQRLGDRKINTWIEIADENDSTILFNPSKILDNGNFREFWLKKKAKDKEKLWARLYSASRSGEPIIERERFMSRFEHTLLRYLADCKTRRLAFVQEVMYFSDQTSENFDLSATGISMTSIVPDSVGEAYWTRACAVK